MAETTTVARPYAQAVFEMARDRQAYAEWSEMLAFMAAVVGDALIARLIDSPSIGPKVLGERLIGVCGDRLDGAARNFLMLLAVNGRLPALPEIARLYEQLRAEAEGNVEATLVSAQPISDAQREHVAGALKTRLGRNVILQCETDPSLLGGAVVRAGDLVIDGSLRGKLEKFATSLA